MSKKAQAKTPEQEIKALYKDIEAELAGAIHFMRTV